MKSTHIDSVTTILRRLGNISLSHHCSLTVASRSEGGSFQSLTRLSATSYALAILLLLASTLMAQPSLVPAPDL